VARTASETGKSSRKPATKSATPRAAPNPRRQRLWRDLALIAVAPLLLFLLASLVTYAAAAVPAGRASPADPGWSHSGSITAPLHNACGRVGAWIADVLLYLTGYVAFLLPIVLGAIAWIALFGMDSDGDGDADLGPALRLVGIVGFLVASCGLLYLRISGSNDFSAGSGGILGQLTGRSLLRGFGPVGANLFLVSLFLISVTLATGLSWLAVMDRIGAFALSLPGLLTRGARKGAQQATDWSEARAFREERVEARKVDSELRAKREKVRIEPPPAPVVEKSERAKREQQIPLFHVADGSGIPPLALLDDPKPQPKGYSEETLETLSRQIEFKLKDFRIDAEVVGAYPGPVITRFEVQPAPGVKVSQISSLDKDIARVEREVGARGRRDPRQIGDRPGNPEHPSRDDLSQRTAAIEGIRQVGQPAHIGVGQGHRRPANRGRPGADAAPAGRRHHRLGQVGGRSTRWSCRCSTRPPRRNCGC
jgi:S-DNA-T family DNA segregation ATPase FtsK/SpoIIIE